jgi:hypothetical protein
MAQGQNEIEGMLDALESPASGTGQRASSGGRFGGIRRNQNPQIKR